MEKAGGKGRMGTWAFSYGYTTTVALAEFGNDEAVVRALVAGRTATGPDAPSLQAAGAADVLTFEHEHQDQELLLALQGEGVPVRPDPRALLLARDKLAMRRAVDEAGLPQPAWAQAAGDADAMVGRIRAFAARHGWPVVLKTCQLFSFILQNISIGI